MIRCPTLLIAVFFAAPIASLADDTSADDALDQREQTGSAPVAGYPRDWCIETWMNSRPGRIRTSANRQPPPAALAYRGAAANQVEQTPEYADRTSLISRLKALRHLRFATLWQGRDRSLVVRVQDGGYIGVSLDGPTDDDN